MEQISPKTARKPTTEGVHQKRPFRSPTGPSRRRPGLAGGHRGACQAAPSLASGDARGSGRGLDFTATGSDTGRRDDGRSPAIERYIASMPSPVNKSRRSLFPIIAERARLADALTKRLQAPAGNFSLYIRAYWGQQGITEGAWTPPAIRNLAQRP